MCCASSVIAVDRPPVAGCKSVMVSMATRTLGLLRGSVDLCVEILTMSSDQLGA